MCDVLNNKQFLTLRNKFLCCVPVKEIGLQEYLTSISWEEQELLINQTIKNNLLTKFPINSSYLKAFLKAVIEILEKNNLEIHDSLYDSYCDILTCNDTEKYYYKHYCAEDKIVSLKENKNFISEGTTGLCSWQASLALSQWCLQNKQNFINKTIVELGSGVGLVGLTLIQHCQPKEVILTDCHPKVLTVLSENVVLNISENINKVLKDSDKVDSFAVGTTVSKTLSAGRDTFDTRGENAINLDSINKSEWGKGDADGNGDADVLLSTVVDGIKVSVLNLPWEYVGNVKCCEKFIPDIVLAADVVYDSSVFIPLVGAVKYFLERNSKAQIIFACTERNLDTLQEFIQLLESSQFEIANIATPKPEIFFWSTVVPIRFLLVTTKNK